MNEFDPTKREHINISPIDRYEADIDHVNNYENLVLAMTRYLSEEFNIDESYVQRIFNEQEDIVPSALLFENNLVLAREQALLMLVKVALPLAENFIDDQDDFINWTTRSVHTALNIESSLHDIEGCFVESPDSWAPHSCLYSGECPIKYTTYKLIESAVKIDYDSPDYMLPWAEQKISRTIAKVEVAQDIKLIEPNFGNSLVHSYLRRVCIPTPNDQFPQ